MNRDDKSAATITIDPWGSTVIKDYGKLFEEFGITPFDAVLDRLQKPHKYMRRKIIFGHRGYDDVADAIINKKPFAVMSGFMPSGRIHLGGKMVMDEIIWHQQQGGSAFVAIADMESHAVRGLSWEKCMEIGLEEYILSLIALGFQPENGYIYFQSKSQVIRDLTFEAGIEANYTELSAIYGLQQSTRISHMVSVLAQSADILQPELGQFGGPKPTVIPVGADQDPHIRLARDIAARMRMFLVEHRGNYISVRARGSIYQEQMKQIALELGGDVREYEEHIDIYDNDDLHAIEEVVRRIEIRNGGYGFILPAATYHRFMSGLTGGKMSSSIPESYIGLTDPPKEAAKKVMGAKTGGCSTLEEQKKHGGMPDECTVYELMLFHLVDDDGQLRRTYDECRSGELMCGTCKKRAAELMESFLKEHQEKREQARGQLDEYTIVGINA